MNDLFGQKKADEAALLAQHHERIGALMPMHELEALRLSGDQRKYERSAHARATDVHKHVKTYAREAREMVARHQGIEAAARIAAQEPAQEANQ